MSMLMYAAQSVADVLAQPPDPGAGEPPPGSDQFTQILSWGAWIVLACCVGGVLLCAGKMALNHRRGMGGGEEGAQLAWPLIACVVTGSASALVGFLI